jgi:hypothetical protein
MKKFLAVLLAMLFCLVSFPIFASAANEDIVASIKGGTAQIGGTITVPVFLDVNKGFVTLGIKVAYDSNILEIVCEDHEEGSRSCSPSVEKVSFASGNQGFNSQYHTNNPYCFQWAYGTASKDISQTGQIASITFKVKNTAKLGDTKVSVEIDQASCYSKEPRTFTGGEANIKLVCFEHISSDTGSITKKPTCTEDGVKTYLCTICGVPAKTENIPAISHNFGAWTKTKTPTCTEAGEETRICANDANHKETKEIKALGHNFGKWTVTKAPTCVNTGEETRVCANDSKHKEVRTLDKARHMVNWQIVKEPTVTSEGQRKGDCSVCGNFITETMPKLTTTLEGDKLGLVTDTKEEQKPADGFKVDSTGEETFSGYVKGEIKETFPKNTIKVDNKTVAAMYDIILSDADNGKTLPSDKVVVLTVPVRDSILSNYNNIALARVDENGKYVVIKEAKLSNKKFVISGKYGSISKLAVIGNKIENSNATDTNSQDSTTANNESSLDAEQNVASSDENATSNEDTKENTPAKKSNALVWTLAIVAFLGIAFILVLISMIKRF